MIKAIHLTTISTIILLGICLWQRYEIIEMTKKAEELVKLGNSIYKDCTEK